MIILTVTHLCLVFKERRRTFARQMKENLSNEQDGVQLQLGSIYQDVDECLSIIQIAYGTNFGISAFPSKSMKS